MASAAAYYKQHTLPISAIIPAGQNETHVTLAPLEGSNQVAANNARSHLFIAYATLNSYQGGPPIQSKDTAAAVKKEEDEEEDEFEQERDARETFEIGMELTFPSRQRTEGGPAVSDASLLTIQREDRPQGRTTAELITNINNTTLRDHSLWKKAALLFDWVDTSWSDTTTDFESEIEFHFLKGGYGNYELEKYQNSENIPSHVNPFLLPPLDCPRSQFIRIRLHLAAGLRAHFTSVKHLEAMGFTVTAPVSTTLTVENPYADNWLNRISNTAPTMESAKVSLRIDIEKSIKVPRITKSIKMKLPPIVIFSNKILLQRLQVELSAIERDTNIRLGITRTDENTFKFLFPADLHRATMTYRISPNLAARLNSPSVRIDSSTVLEKEVIKTEETVAATILSAQATGIIYVVSQNGRDPYWPGKLLAMLEPHEDGSFRLITEPFNAVPQFIADGNFLAQIPNGRLGLQLYVHNPINGQFYPFEWHENLKLQGFAIYRESVRS